MPEEGQLRLLNPLNIRFSQPRIAPHFRDGRLLEETANEVNESPLRRGVSDTFSGVSPPYDLILLPPFPAIRVISWLPKLRHTDGEAQRNNDGTNIMGKRAWFALDNRRLHTLQYTAAKRWPRQCCIVVRCLEEVPGRTIRELRKFRTTTEGRNVEVGVRAGETEVWSWQSCVPHCNTASAVLEPDGAYADDLWDAERYVSQSTITRSRRLIELDDRSINSLNRSSVTRRGELRACPNHGWEYVDPAGKKQGPFPLANMKMWFHHGFFSKDLMMRCSEKDVFAPLVDLFPKPLEPFGSRVMRFKP